MGVGAPRPHLWKQFSEVSMLYLKTCPGGVSTGRSPAMPPVWGAQCPQQQRFLSLFGFFASRCIILPLQTDSFRVPSKCDTTPAPRSRVRWCNDRCQGITSTQKHSADERFRNVLLPALNAEVRRDERTFRSEFSRLPGDAQRKRDGNGGTGVADWTMISRDRDG
jgi:hypothetical protein